MPSQASAHLDFSLARRGQLDLPIKVESWVEDAEVIGTQPANVVVILESRVIKTAATIPRDAQILPRAPSRLR